MASERQQTCRLSQVGTSNCFDVLCLNVLLTALERQPAGNRRSLALDQLGFACSRMHVAAMKQLSCPYLSIKTPIVEDLVFACVCVEWCSAGLRLGFQVVVLHFLAQISRLFLDADSLALKLSFIKQHAWQASVSRQCHRHRECHRDNFGQHSPIVCRLAGSHQRGRN